MSANKMIFWKKKKQPKILATKIAIFDLLRKHHILFNQKVDKSPIHNYYCGIVFVVDGITYRIYKQMYVLKRHHGVNYITLTRINDYKRLTVKEINELIVRIKKQLL